MATIGEKLKDIRINEMKLTQSQFADEVFTTSEVINNIENNQKVATTKEKIPVILDYASMNHNEKDVREILNGKQIDDAETKLKKANAMKMKTLKEDGINNLKLELQKEKERNKKLKQGYQNAVDEGKEKFEDRMMETYNYIEQLEKELNCIKLKQHNIDSLIERFSDSDHGYNKGIIISIKTVKQVFDGQEAMSKEKVE